METERRAQSRREPEGCFRKHAGKEMGTSPRQSGREDGIERAQTCGYIGWHARRHTVGFRTGTWRDYGAGLVANAMNFRNRISATDDRLTNSKP